MGVVLEAILYDTEKNFSCLCVCFIRKYGPI